MPKHEMHIPVNATACLVLADGHVFFGQSIGAETTKAGEICFNTGMTGYQETLTDPSYTGQIITFTFPHIGNVGCNDEDIEGNTPRCAGLVVREPVTPPSSFRSRVGLTDWLISHDIPGICGVDTRALTRHIRKNGAQNAAIVGGGRKTITQAQIQEAATLIKSVPDMVGLDLASQVSTPAPHEWNSGVWQLFPDSKTSRSAEHNVIAIDYGVKQNILRNLTEAGCRITVVPATMPAKDILALKPDGVFLSNGPGDPAATGEYSIPVIKALIDADVPIFGICLGHQMLALALGAKTEKMKQGHRGANHPVKELGTGRVMITSQNHGFAVAKEGLPAELEVTHISLFDQTIQGLKHKHKPLFCLQGHPEASPGPHDTQEYFQQFVQMMKDKKQKNVA